jgi:hypothetical protein
MHNMMLHFVSKHLLLSDISINKPILGFISLATTINLCKVSCVHHLTNILDSILWIFCEFKSLIFRVFSQFNEYGVDGPMKV